MSIVHVNEWMIKSFDRGAPMIVLVYINVYLLVTFLLTVLIVHFKLLKLDILSACLVSV